MFSSLNLLPEEFLGTEDAHELVLSDSSAEAEDASPERKTIHRLRGTIRQLEHDLRDALIRCHAERDHRMSLEVAIDGKIQSISVLSDLVPCPCPDLPIFRDICQAQRPQDRLEQPADDDSRQSSEFPGRGNEGTRAEEEARAPEEEGSQSKEIIMLPLLVPRLLLPTGCLHSVVSCKK